MWQWSVGKALQRQDSDAWLLAEARAEDEVQHAKHGIAGAAELLAKAEREVRPLVRPLKVIYQYIYI